MIYTVTCNPCLDYVMHFDEFHEGAVNRSTSESIAVGGKGVNVSVVLARLGIPTCALGFIAGDTGLTFKRMIKDFGVEHDLITLSHGTTRVNVQMKRFTTTEGGETHLIETGLNGRGPDVEDEYFDLLMAKVNKLTEDDCLILSGTGHSTASKDLYLIMATSAKNNGAKCVIDATGELLTRSLGVGPTLIKPNNYELAEIAHCNPDDKDALVDAAQELVKLGAQNVLVSCGGTGAFLVNKDGLVADKPAKKGLVINTTGSGDSMVAGTIAGYMGALAPAGTKPGNWEHALEVGIAAGSATAFSTGLATREKIQELLEQK